MRPPPAEKPHLAGSLEMTEVPSESNREYVRWFQREHALELFRAHRLRIPSEARLARKDPGDPHAHVQASSDGEDTIVEYMNDRGLWEPARVTSETFEALLDA